MTKYVCQSLLFGCGLGLLIISLVPRHAFSLQLTFVFLYGVFAGGCTSTLKVFVYKSAKSRFATVWSLVQMVQAIPNCGSVAVIAFLNQKDNEDYSSVIGGVSAIIASACLFLITLDRYLRKQDKKGSNGVTCKKHSSEDRDEMSLKYLRNIGEINGINSCDIFADDGKNNVDNNFVQNITSCNKVSKKLTDMKSILTFHLVPRYPTVSCWTNINTIWMQLLSCTSELKGRLNICAI